IQVTPIPWDRVDEVIIPPPEKFADKETKTMRDRSTCLNDVVGREVTLEELREVLKRSCEKAFGLTMVNTEIFWDKVPGYDAVKGMLTSDSQNSPGSLCSSSCLKRERQDNQSTDYGFAPRFSTNTRIPGPQDRKRGSRSPN
ncbi:MAG: hypothetical protein ACTSRV_17630, partial [Candidatus Freyarchaeota archaeon]